MILYSEAYCEFIGKPIRVGSTRYDIVVVERLQDEESEACDGMVDMAKSLIEVDHGHSLQSTRDIVVHECIHAILLKAGYPTTEHKEKHVEALTHGIISLFIDNPWLLAPETLGETTPEEKT